MKRFMSALLCIILLATMMPISSFAAESVEEEYANSAIGSTDENDGFRANTDTSIYCWNMYLLNEGSFPAALSFLRDLNTHRVYQDISKVYLLRSETADMVNRLTENGIEVVALTGDRAWGKENADLTEIKSYIDALVTYNKTIGVTAPITKLALDVETYTYSGWKKDPLTWFAAYIKQMKEIYDYAKAYGFSVVQVIPTHFDDIDETLFKNFLQTCTDELSLMNYEKETQVTAIAGETEICRELGMHIETVFETMPKNDNYSVTEENTYFYDGFDALCAKRDEILNTYRYENLTASYHYFQTLFHVVTGTYLAEIYAYTSSNDPTINDLGQTEALSSIILTGDDGSIITAGLYNPNRGAEYEETCYLAVGVREGVTYTISAGSPNYEIINPTKTFTFGEDEIVNYSSIRIRALEQSIPTFTVTFLNYDGTVLKTEEVESGAAASAPSAPQRTPDENGHYTFIGWNHSFDCVNSDLTIKAVYSVSEHTTELMGYKAPTCAEEGYSGDLVCTVCGETVKKGEVIPKTEHSWNIHSNENGTHSQYCTVCGTSGITSDCADSNRDGKCDICGSEMESSQMPTEFIKKNNMTEGKAYMIFSGNYALNKSLSGTKITMYSNNGTYISDKELSEDLLWYYDNGKIFCESEGVIYYLGCDSRKLIVTDNEADAAIWTCSDGRIYTYRKITSWWQYKLNLRVFGSRFTLSIFKKTLTFYEAC